MKKFEIIIATTKHPRLTVTPDRVTIKHDGKSDYTTEIEFLKKVAEELKDTDTSLRGDAKWQEDGTLYLNMRKREYNAKNKKTKNIIVQSFSYTNSTTNTQ